MTLFNRKSKMITSGSLKHPFVRARKGTSKRGTHPRLLNVAVLCLAAVAVLRLGSHVSIQDDTNASSCGEFRWYPSPDHHQGLPFLAEVFAGDRGRSVYFVALNKGACRSEWRHAQEFHSNAKVQNHFVCRFPDGTTVQSDPVHEKWEDDYDWSNAVMVIRCDIPEQYRVHVEKPYSTTKLFVDLFATKDLEASPPLPLPLSHETAFLHLPVCHGERWGLQRDFHDQVKGKPKKRFLSTITKIKLSYCPHEGGGCKSPSERVTIDPRQVIAWIEHHHSIGFEHFYIYDNEPEQHGKLEAVLRPYVEQGLVTYVWYPLEDCTVNFKGKDKQIGDRFTDSQASATTAALRRYEDQTTYLAHFDIDEYIIPPQDDTSHNFQNVVKNYLDYDSISLELTWFSACQNESNTQVASNEYLLPFDEAHCYNRDKTPWKSIMKTNRVLAFFVHLPFATTDGKVASNDKHLGDILVAHYRTQRARDNTTSATTFQNRSSGMDLFRKQVHNKVNAHLALLSKK